MSGAKPIIVETRHDPEAAAAAQTWGRKSMFPLWMRVFRQVVGAATGVLAGAGVLVLTQLAVLEIDPQMRSRLVLLLPIFCVAAVLFLWERYQKYFIARMNLPRGDGAERYVFDADGITETADGAERRFAWWLVDDFGQSGDAIFIRIGTVLHTIPKVGTPADIDAIRALWLAGRRA